MSLEGSGLNQVSLFSPGKHVPSLQHRAPFCQGLSPWKGPQKIPDPALSRSGGKTEAQRKAWLLQGIQQVREAWRAEAQSGRKGVCNGWRQGFCDIWSGWGWGWVGERDSTAPPGWQPSPCGGAGGSEKRPVRCSSDLSASDITVPHTP
ncbi:unnamed protein product [Rangifer tarandus platyrhynchus]|uniref:Uncharacterized protein n=1 Tax=Rangifer tarandus platyrhynchus TaxID=3082113 RepID=A0AC59YV90_RANTA